MMSVCMNRIGAPSRAVIGDVDLAMGASAASMSSRGTVSGMGPTPDDPVIVMCGTDVFASRRSIFSWAARTISRASPVSSAMMKMPSTGKEYVVGVAEVIKVIEAIRVARILR